MPSAPRSGFERAFDLVLAHEGLNYIDEPDDSGGPTRYGVTLRSWASYVGRPQCANDIAALTVEDARRFYAEIFWQPLLGDALCQAGAEPHAVALFDVCVLNGLHQGVRLAQRVVGTKPDGVMGPNTLRALAAMPAAAFLQRFVTRVLLRYVDLVAAEPRYQKFLKGWVARGCSLLTIA